MHMRDKRFEQIDAGNAFTIFRSFGEGREGFIADWYDRFTDATMAESFKEAAEVLAANRREMSPRGDTAFWPVAYLHRHAHELILKTLLPKAVDLAEESLSNRAKKLLLDHDLNALWRRTRYCVCKIWTDGDEEALSGVDTTIKDLHAIDPRGDAFRYSTSLDGSPHLQELPFSVSIDHFCNEASASFDYLNGVLMGVEHYLDTRNEMLAEYRADMRAEMDGYY